MKYNISKQTVISAAQVVADQLSQLSIKEKIILGTVSFTWAASGVIGVVMTRGSKSQGEDFEAYINNLEIQSQTPEGLNEIVFQDIDFSYLINVDMKLRFDHSFVDLLDPSTISRLCVVFLRFMDILFQRHQQLISRLEYSINNESTNLWTSEYENIQEIDREYMRLKNDHPIVFTTLSILESFLLYSSKKTDVFGYIITSLNHINKSHLRYLLIGVLAQTSYQVPIEELPTSYLLPYYHHLKAYHQKGFLYKSINHSLTQVANILIDRLNDGDITEPLETLKRYGGHRYRSYLPHQLVVFKESVLIDVIGASFNVLSGRVSLPLQLCTLFFSMNNHFLDYLPDLSQGFIGAGVIITTYVLGKKNWKSFMAAASVPVLSYIMNHITQSNLTSNMNQQYTDQFNIDVETFKIKEEEEEEGHILPQQP